MKISCKVAQDLIPLYHDGICSDDSSALVEEHLKSCHSCTGLLNALKGEFALPQSPKDDLKPLKAIEKSIKKGKCRSLGKGAIGAIALILALLLGTYGIWYGSLGKYYARIADKMEPVQGEMAAMTSATYYLEEGNYGVLLQKPFPFSDSGFVRVGEYWRTVGYLKGEYYTVSAGMETVYVDLFFYPQTGGGYKFALSFESRGEEILGWVWVNPDLSPNMEEDFYDLEEQKEYEGLLQEHRMEIEALFQIVEDQFGIEYLQ